MMKLISVFMNLVIRFGSVVFMVLSLLSMHQTKVLDAILYIGWAIMLHLIARED